MGAFITQLLLQAVLPTILKMVANYFTNNEADKKDWEFLVKFTETMRNRQLLNAKFRLDAEDQLKEIDAKIDAIERKDAEG